MRKNLIVAAFLLLVTVLTAVILNLNIPKPLMTTEPKTKDSLSVMAPASTVPAALTVTAPATTVPATTTVPPTVSLPPISSSIPPSSSVPTEEMELLSLEERLYIDELIRSYPGVFSVYYKDLSSAEVYTYQPDTLYYAASLVKVPYAYYLLTLADQGEIDLDMKLVLSKHQKQSGTGELKNAPDGSEYTIRELIEYMITISDNTAFKMLRDQYSLWDYNKFCRKTLGVYNVTYENVTATDMAICMEAVYNYINTASANALFLKDIMSRATFCNIKASEAELIIHKHGWANPSFNDMALVYGERDYLIVIMSDRCDGEKEDIKMFHAISLAIYEAQKTLSPVPSSSSAPQSTAALTSTAPSTSL